eukprot:2004621-Pyramimonas_sp.AAC.1
MFNVDQTRELEHVARSVTNDPNPNVETFIRWVGSGFHWELYLGGGSEANEYHRLAKVVTPLRAFLLARINGT